ncbi:zinc finger protein 729-like isoform X2 [Chrysoperla carnea]|uniref:zinc finger protein 729-like isoform X2 n=1 Tax=Chrysoperla carnea TaxID=189513 RepID=UPI001D089CC1|nr:zinc finger protein 729-like isoform X2 [Chrysoperla carnea]
MRHSVCFYRGCYNSKKSRPDLTFHRFPPDKERLIVWVKRSGNGAISKEDCKAWKHRTMCSIHFNVEDYKIDCRKPILHSTAIPKEFHPSADHGSVQNEISIKGEIECLSNDSKPKESECTTVEKWNNKCITCLKDDVQMETLSSLSLLPEFKELFKYLRIEDFLNETTLNSVCSNCVLQMHNMLSFKRQCEESVEKLGLFTTALISETVKSSIVHKATKTESEEEISSNFLVQISPDVEEEPDKIEHTEIEQEFDSFSFDEECVSCVNCNEKFNNERWLRRHQILIHGLKNCIQECYDCLQLHFINYENRLKIHNECYHENICSVCDLKFQTIIHLAKHRLLHTLSDPKKHLPLSGFDGFKSRRPRGKVACAQCGKFYNTAKLLRRHIRSVHNPNRVKMACTICRRSVYNLNEHLKWHQTHKFQHKIAVRRKSVPRKKKYDFIEPRGLCTYCGKLYVRTSLKKHILAVHLKKKNYECMYCHKMFVSTNVRNRHIKVAHLKLKRFSCGYCDKKFSTKFNAQKHRLIHTKEKPFKCQYCDELFRYPESIKHHIIRKHGVNSSSFRINICTILNSLESGGKIISVT